jgi:hypothetical protein
MRRAARTATWILIGTTAALMPVASCAINPQPEPPDRATGEPTTDASTGGFGGQAGADAAPQPEGAPMGGSGGTCDNCMNGDASDNELDACDGDGDACDGDAGGCDADAQPCEDAPGDDAEDASDDRALQAD